MPNRLHSELTLKQTWLPHHSLNDVTARRGSTITPSSDPWTPATPQASRTLSLPEQHSIYGGDRKCFSGLENLETNSTDTTSTTSANTAGDEGVHVCICPPDPKIPRPRNAFILYRQHHQASVVHQHPNLANPDISKIIGEQWQNQSQETKNKWKALAEEEKQRHQLQYPGYRYQPKRTDRRNSLLNDPPSTAERSKCPKCGGRTTLAPSTAHLTQNQNTNSVPQTPQSAITPGARTVPQLLGLSLQSPIGHQVSHEMSNPKMSSNHFRVDDQSDSWPVTPDWKRRRMSSLPDQSDMAEASMHTRYGTQNASSGPYTPFPFRQEQVSQSQVCSKRPFPTAPDQSRRESLPPMKSVVNSPAMMGPPPKPVMGYQQHRIAQGHATHDRSLTLPPLQTGRLFNESSSTFATAVTTQTLEEQIMLMPFRYKITVLGRIARPAFADEKNPRGPLIAVEGDDADAVRELVRWLVGELKKGSDLDVQLFDGPEVKAMSDVKKPMVQYHQLIADWLIRSDNIIKSIACQDTTAPVEYAKDNVSPTGAEERIQLVGEHNINHKDVTSSTMMSEHGPSNFDCTHKNSTGQASESLPSKPSVDRRRPVGVIPNFSLHASNVFACRIPVEANEAYTSSDHWSWTATQWRGIVGPDLTIYVRDSNGLETGRSSVEMLEEGNLFLVKRVDTGKGLEVEASASRRLAFEVSEWVRAFGSTTPESS